MINNIMRFILMFLLLNNSLGLNINSRRDIFTGLFHSPLLFNKNDVSKDFNLNYNLLDNKQSNGIIKRNKNNIYFYSPVTQVSCFELSRMLLDIDTESKLFNCEFKIDAPPINLHIQSEGGSLLHALYVTDIIKKLDTPVYTYIDGFAASAATLISIAGNKRYTSENSLMLIHQLSGSSEGKYNEIEDEMQNFDNIMNIVINLYLNNTNINKNKLLEILKKDIWLDSETCLDYGLVDQIL